MSIAKKEFYMLEFQKSLNAFEIVQCLSNFLMECGFEIYSHEASVFKVALIKELFRKEFLPLCEMLKNTATPLVVMVSKVFL